MKTFEEILQEELGKYGCVTFAHFLWKNKPNAIKLLKAVSERLANEAVKEYFTVLPVYEWHEDMGECLFFQTPVCESPSVTSPISSDWVEEYYTHFMIMKKWPVPDEHGLRIPSNSNHKDWLPFPQPQEK